MQDNVGVMLTCISALLGPGEIQKLRGLAERGRFVDGRRSAGRALHDVKHNLELETTPEETRQVNATILGALSKNPLFRSAAKPKRMTSPIVSCYTEGMAYGTHTDSPMMGQEDPLRSDLSITIFLSEPDSYDGGELVLESPFGEEQVKLMAGDAVIYPTTMAHRVAPVTRGSRVVAITWIQSYVKDPAQRQLLHEMQGVVDKLASIDPQSDETMTLKRIHSNLTRMWVEA